MSHAETWMDKTEALIVLCFVYVCVWLFVRLLAKLDEWDREWAEKQDADRMNSWRRSDADD